MEELRDKEGLDRIEKSLEEYKKREYVVAPTTEKAREIFMKD